jgi:hypothetical protein
MNESNNEFETDLEEEGGHGAGSYLIELFFLSKQGYEDLLAAAGKATETGNLPRAASLTNAAQPEPQALQKGICLAARGNARLGRVERALRGLNSFVAIEGTTPDVLLPALEKACSNLESSGAPKATAGQAPMTPTTRAGRGGAWGRPKRGAAMTTRTRASSGEG